MRVTIIPADNMVIVDGRAVEVDLSVVDDNYRAIHWFNEGSGYIETGQGDNVPISDMTSFQFALDTAFEKLSEMDGPPSIEQAKAIKRREVSALMASKLGAGIEHPPGSKHIIQIQEKDQDRIGNVALLAIAAKLGASQWPSDMAWRTKDNKPLPLPTADSMLELASAAAAKVSQIREASWAHKDAIDALSTVEQVESYDTSTGWPA